jgi:hypothetical protein
MYIMEHVAENGFDTTKFNNYFAAKYSKSFLFISFCCLDANMNVDQLSYE